MNVKHDHRHRLRLPWVLFLAVITVSGESGARDALIDAAPVQPAEDTMEADTLSVAARPSRWQQEHATGWFWYQEEPSELPSPEPEAADTVTETTGEEDPRLLLQAWRDRVEKALARATLQPSDRNVQDYMRLNERTLALAGDFSLAWQRVLRGSPELDYRLRHPADDASLQSWRHHEARAADAALEQLAGTHGLLFFFSSDCPICHRFAPILRSFSHRYGFQVKAVTLDGNALPSYPQPEVNRRAAQHLGVTAVPALFLIMPEHRWARPVGYGLMGTAELGRRVLIAAEEMRLNPSHMKYAGR